MPQLLIPKNSEYINKLLDLVERFVDLVPAYLLKCNMTKEAAFVFVFRLCKTAIR